MSVYLSAPIRACVPYFNATTRQLTEFLVSRFFKNTDSYNPRIILKEKISKKPILQYDIKVTCYNLATIAIVCNTILFARDSLSIQPTLIASCSLFFIRDIARRSLDEPLPPSQVIEKMKIGSAKAYLKLKKNWREDMIPIGYFTILKNWHITIPRLIQKIAKRLGFKK